MVGLTAAAAAAPPATAPAERGVHVFLASVEEDRAFAEGLRAALAERGLGFECADGPGAAWEDLPSTYAAIESAEAFVAILTPAAIASDAWRLQLAHAVRQHKRLVPVLHAEVETSSVPPELARLNWIFFRDQDARDTSLAALVEGITIDVDWLHLHTRLLTRAQEWRQAGWHPSLLLTDPELRAIEDTVRERPVSDMPLTRLQWEYLLTSRRVATAAEARRAARLATAAIGVLEGVAFLPLALVLSSAIPGPAHVVLAVIISAAVGALAAAAFGGCTAAALWLAEHRPAAALVAGLGATLLGSVAGLEGGFVALTLAHGLTDWLTLLVATGVAAGIQTLALRVVFKVNAGAYRTAATAVLTGALLGTAVGASLGRVVIAIVQAGLVPPSFATPLMGLAFYLALLAACASGVACAAVVLAQGLPPAAPSPQAQTATAIDPDEHVTRAFISYSRKDKAFVQRLHDALRQRHLDTWVDWEGIPLTADWLREIEAAIEASELFVFVVSPDSASSVVCGLEVAHAAAHHKRLIPVLHRDVDAAALPPPLRGLSPVQLREGDDLEAGLRQLDHAVQTDLAWLRAHTRLLTRAVDWEARLRHDGALLRGRALAEIAQAFALAGHALPPRLTPLQMDYVRASWSATTRAAARFGAWLTTGVFGGLAAVAVLVGIMTHVDATAELQAVVPVAVFAGIVGCLVAGLVSFGILQLECAGQPASGERHLTVWLAVLFATLVGSAGFLTLLANAAFPNPFIGSLVTLSQHPLAGTVLAAVLAALIVRGVVVPLRRLHPFQSADAEAPVRAEARRRRSRRRLIWTLGVLGVLELGNAALVATDAVGVLVLAFAIAAGIIVAQSKAPNAAWPRKLASVGAALGGAACGLGITLIGGEVLVIPGSFVAALVAANGVLALEPRHLLIRLTS